ncbi:MAG: ornithine carbamoyltransferase [Campylobacterales bacterium]|nr:ornithine carbamoyltransferase [Campylobacterales bacterium]
MRHFLSIKDYTKEELLEIIDLAMYIKKEFKNERTDHLEDKTLGMIFEKSSTRTRVSFEVGMYQLGGHALFLSSKDIQLGRGEPMKDTARVLSRMVDMVMIRTFSHEKLEEFAKYSSVPVINGLTDNFHPVQIMADFLTMKEKGLNENSSVAWIGDGNNMANSWLMFASIVGLDFRIASPVGYEIPKEWQDIAQENAKKSGAKITFTNDPNEACRDADVVTTDVWASMGQEEEQKIREKAFAEFTVTKEMMNLTNNGIFMHCLPVHREEEVTEEVFEEHADTVFDEAENRLHAQKGIMVWLDRQRSK